MTKPVLVLGGTGMIGFGTVRSLRDRGIDVVATTRHPDVVPASFAESFVRYDFAVDDLATLLDGYGDGDVVVNCAGLIKQYIDDANLEHRLDAIAANAVLPTELARLAAKQGFRVIHITTDCVYSGATGSYLESDAHDALDVYGKSKSLGEIAEDSVLTLRCSIIGPELRGFKSLLHWVLSQSHGATIRGFTDHEWNGLTSTAFGRVVAGVVATGNPVSGLVHLVPADAMSKDQLSRRILEAGGRDDVTVEPTVTGSSVNRILSTERRDDNDRLWLDAGYGTAPTIAHLISELELSTNPNGVDA